MCEAQYVSPSSEVIIFPFHFVVIFFLLLEALSVITTLTLNENMRLS